MFEKVNAKHVAGIVAAVVVIALVAYGIYYAVQQKKHETMWDKMKHRFGAAPQQQRRQRSAGTNQRYGASQPAQQQQQQQHSAYDGSYPSGDMPPILQMQQEENRGMREQMMDVNKLMPSSWREDADVACPPGEKDEETLWTKYAPTKQQYDQYIAAAGSARLSMNSRSPMSRTVGMPNPLNLLRPAAKVPLGGYQSDFLDTDLRQSLIYDAVGQYPESTAC